jgi:methylglyoxal/glyoxal reductase
MEGTLASKVKLNNGVEIPWLGLGVFQARAGEETRGAVRAALDAGYRHIDTARIYGNERDVGRALQESGVPRSEVFITTKLWNADQGYDRAVKACNESLKTLGLTYVDLYLIHFPVQGLRGESWRALGTLLGEGKCRAIGVSNYMIRHLDELLQSSPVVPAVNQVEQSPFLHQPDLLRYCARHGIRVEAYSPLTKGMRLDHPTVEAVAARHRRTPAQILIRWALEHELVVLPKSTRKERIEENATVFDFSLDAADLRALDGLNENLHTGWDPTDAP